MAVRYSDPFTRYLNDNFVGIPGAELFFYEPGQTTVLKDTFKDELGVTANTNPVVSDGFGTIPDIFLEGTYGVELRLSPENSGEKGVLINAADPVTGESSAGQFTDWDETVTYTIGKIRRGDDGCYYNSLVNNNVGFNPTNEGNPSKWEKILFVRVYNAFITYVLNDAVRASDGEDYQLTSATSLGNDPTTDSQKNWTKQTLTPVITSAAKLFAYRNL